VATTQSTGKDSKEEGTERSGFISMTLPCVRMLLQYVVNGRSHDSSVSIVNQLQAGEYRVQFMAGVTDISLLQNVQTNFVMPPASYQWLMGVTMLVQPLA
jgi:hypothetical protein